MNKVHAISVFILSLACSGCSHRQTYEGMQASQRLECLKVPASQYDECMEKANKPYHIYKKEVEEILNEEDNKGG